MSTPCTESLTIRLTPQERTLLEGLAEVRRIAPSELMRELIGLEREERIKHSTRPALRLVPARRASTSG